VSSNHLHPASVERLRELIAEAIGVYRKLGDGIMLAAEYLESDRDRPPLELLEALRAPAGCPRLVTVQVGGACVDVEVTPTGKADPAAEQQVWEHIRTLVDQAAA